MACRNTRSFSKCITQTRCGCMAQSQKRSFSLRAKGFTINGSSHNMNSILNQLKDCFAKSSSQNSSLKNDKNISLFKLSTEWINFLQKMSPASMLGIQFQNVSTQQTKSMQEKNNEQIKIKKVTQIPKIVQEPNKDIIRHWQASNSGVSKISILSSTCHILSSISTAETVSSKLKRIEELIDHISKFPAARIYSVKEGAIKILLRTRETFKDEALQQIIREALAILGYTDPLPGKGIRILSIDGGGIRGIAVIELLKKLEHLSGKRISDMFDFVCGVSTGSIILSTVAIPDGRSLDEALQLYMSLSTDLFTQNKIWGYTWLVYNHSYYDTQKFEALLKEYIGEIPMIHTSRKQNCPKLAAVSTIVNRDKALPYIFRNYCLPYQRKSQYLGNHQYAMWQAARASSAAPSYFEEFHLDGLVHQDGGVVVNNPAAVAIHEASLLWPNTPIQCIVSCGTGRIVPKIDREYSYEHECSPLPPVKETTSSSLFQKFRKVLDSATDTEGVHVVLSDLLPQGKYFRFNPYLTDYVNMDETNREKLIQLRLDTDMYIRKNEKKFNNAVKLLSEEKSMAQKAKDYIQLHAYLMNAHL